MIAFIILAVCLLGFPSNSLAQASVRFPEKREFEFFYSAQITDLPLEKKEIRIWVPLGATRDGQKVIEREIETDGGYTYTVSKESAYGNDILYFSLKAPLPRRFHFKIKYRVLITQKDFIQRDLSVPIQNYLSPSRFMVVNDQIRERSKIVTRNRQGLMDKARGLYEYVLTHMRYDKTIPGWGQGDTLRACQVGAGNCTDFHSLFISLAHAAEIPARFKIGVTVPEDGEGEIPGYHCWAEFYDDERGWEPVDASEAWKKPQRKEDYFGNFDTNKFLISVGRDLQLLPRQKGDPINIFFYPYVEVDGAPYDGVQTSFGYKSLKN